MHDLATGAAHDSATSGGPIDGPSTGTPNAFSWPLDAFALSTTGRTARLYASYPANAGTGATPAPDREVLDVVGFHEFKRTLATAVPGAIGPSSLHFRGHTVTWTDNGAPHSATA